MEWTAENIRQLRVTAQITQAQLATWLRVTVKQVKHLENRRRNPSGPVERLLDIFSKEVGFSNGETLTSVQILSAPRRTLPKPRRQPATHEEPTEPAQAPPDDAMIWDG
jgi:DNA-binding XRE family transcriptional regulator